MSDKYIITGGANFKELERISRGDSGGIAHCVFTPALSRLASKPTGRSLVGLAVFPK